MRAPLVLLAAILPVAAAAGLYQLKHRVEATRARVEALEAHIAAEAEALRVLEAEWAYLTSPDMLQRHSLRFLGLLPPSPERVAQSPAGLPVRKGDLHVTASGENRAILPAPRSKPVPPGTRVAARPSGFSHRMERAIARAGGER